MVITKYKYGKLFFSIQFNTLLKHNFLTHNILFIYHKQSLINQFIQMF